MEMTSPDQAFQAPPEVIIQEASLDEAAAHKVFLIKLSIYIVIGLIITSSFAGLVYSRYLSLQSIREDVAKKTEDLYIKKTDVQYAPASTNLSLSPSTKANTVVEWYDKPIKLDDLGLIQRFAKYNCDEFGVDYPYLTESRSIDEESYYELGKNGNNKIVLVTFYANQSGKSIYDKANLFFEQTPSGQYIFMHKMFVFTSGYFTAGIYIGEKFYESSVQDKNIHRRESCGGYVVPDDVHGLTPQDISVDTNTYYSGVDWPLTITYNNLHLRIHDNPGGIPATLFEDNFGPGKNYDRLAASSEGDLYSLWDSLYDSSDNIFPDLITKSFVLKLPSGLYSKYYIDWDFFDAFSAYYGYADPYQVPEKKPEVTWNNHNKNKDRYNDGLFPGICGAMINDKYLRIAADYVVSTKDLSTDLKETGLTSKGQSIYEFKDQNNPILKFIYGFSLKSDGSSYKGYDKDHHQVIVYKYASDGTRPDYFIFFNTDQDWQEQCERSSGLELW